MNQCFQLSITGLNYTRNWVFVTNSDFLITISLEPNVADLRYFKLWILLDQIIWVWNIKGLQPRVIKILRFKYLILFQRLNSYSPKFWTVFWRIKMIKISIMFWLRKIKVLLILGENCVKKISLLQGDMLKDSVICEDQLQECQNIRSSILESLYSCPDR